MATSIQNDFDSSGPTLAMLESPALSAFYGEEAGGQVDQKSVVGPKTTGDLLDDITVVDGMHEQDALTSWTSMD